MEGCCSKICCDCIPCHYNDKCCEHLWLCVTVPSLGCAVYQLLCSKIAEAEAAVSVNEKKWLVMHMHVQLQLDELWGPQTLGSL